MKTRAVLVGAGVLAMAYAGYGVLTDPAAGPFGILVFLIAVLVAHDAVWMPVVLAVGVLLTRLVPPRHRPLVRAAVLSAAAVTVVALPLVLGFGRTADNPSALPLPYGRNLTLVLLAIAVATALTVLARRVRDRHAAGKKRDRYLVRKKSESAGDDGPDAPDG